MRERRERERGERERREEEETQERGEDRGRKGGQAKLERWGFGWDGPWEAGGESEQDLRLGEKQLEAHPYPPRNRQLVTGR